MKSKENPLRQFFDLDETGIGGYWLSPADLRKQMQMIGENIEAHRKSEKKSRLAKNRGKKKIG